MWLEGANQLPFRSLTNWPHGKSNNCTEGEQGGLLRLQTCKWKMETHLKHKRPSKLFWTLWLKHILLLRPSKNHHENTNVPLCISLRGYKFAAATVFANKSVSFEVDNCPCSDEHRFQMPNSRYLGYVFYLCFLFDICPISPYISLSVVRSLTWITLIEHIWMYLNNVLKLHTQITKKHNLHLRAHTHIHILYTW